MPYVSHGALAENTEFSGDTDVVPAAPSFTEDESQQVLVAQLMANALGVTFTAPSIDWIEVIQGENDVVGGRDHSYAVFVKPVEDGDSEATFTFTADVNSTLVLGQIHLRDGVNAASLLDATAAAAGERDGDNNGGEVTIPSYDPAGTDVDVVAFAFVPGWVDSAVDLSTAPTGYTFRYEVGTATDTDGSFAMCDRPSDGSAISSANWDTGGETDFSGNTGVIFGLTAAASVSAAVTGTAGDGATEGELQAGGETEIITLTGDTWVPDDGTFAAARQSIIDGLDFAALAAGLAVTDVVRTSDTVVTITYSAIPGLSIEENVVVEHTIPGSALTGGNPIVATPTFTITATSLAAGTATIGTIAHDEVQASATDATEGNPPYTYQWQRSPRGAATWSDVSGQTTLNLTDATVVAETNYDYRLRYTDDSAAETFSNTIEADVPAANEGPVVTITSPPGNIAVTAGTKIVLEFTAVDAEDGNIAAAAEVTSSNTEDGTGGDLGTGSPLEIDTTGMEAGARTISVTATDSEDEEDEDSFVLTIGEAANTPIMEDDMDVVRQSGVATTIRVPLRSPTTGALLTSNPLAAGDVLKSVDGAAAAVLTDDANAATWDFVNGRVEIPMAAGELTGSEITLRIHDESASAFADKVVTITVVAYNPATAPEDAEDIAAAVAAELGDGAAFTALTPAAVRTELATELGRIDADVSSRATPAQVAAELATYDAATGAQATALAGLIDDVGTAIANLANLDQAGVQAALTAQGLSSAAVTLLLIAARLSASSWSREGDVITLADGTTLTLTEAGGKVTDVVVAPA